jgi:LysM repeat protein
MLRDKRYMVLGLALCLLLMLGMVGCVRVKPPREREPLPTVVVEVEVIDSEAIAMAEIDADVDEDVDTEDLEPVEIDEETVPTESEPTEIDSPAEATEDEEVPTATSEPMPAPTPYAGPIYVVAPGDTLSSIAALHGSTVQAFVEANSLNSSAALRVGQELRLPADVDPLYDVDATETDIYVVRFGDTLSQIAARHRMPVGQLLALNPTVRTSSILRPGMELTVAVNPIPEGAVVHVVQAGQTLESIARRYGVSIFDLAQINFLTDANRLDVGQVLVIPQQ